MRKWLERLFWRKKVWVSHEQRRRRESVAMIEAERHQWAEWTPDMAAVIRKSRNG